MPNKNIHVPVGAVTGFLSVGAMPKKWPGPYILEALGAVIGGLVGSQLPDIIDPPTSPRHRGKAHSIAGAVTENALLTVAIMKLEHEIDSLYSLIEEYRYNGFEIPASLIHRLIGLRACYGFVFGFGAGWLSHLALDVCTPDGLRLINSKF